jgi:hypothetical protein
MTLARGQAVNCARVTRVTLINPGRKGFLGIGKRPDCYEVQIAQQAVVQIYYKEKAKIRITVGEKKISGEKEAGISSMKSIKGGLGEPYCSDECWSKAGKKITKALGILSVGLDGRLRIYGNKQSKMGQTTYCHFCERKMVISPLFGISAVPYAGKMIFICPLCRSKAKKFFKEYKNCCLCKKSL